MKNQLFQVQMHSGEMFSVNMPNIVQVAQRYPEAEQIKQLDRATLQRRVNKLNADLRSVCYLDLAEIDDFFQRVLTENGFGYPVDDIFMMGRSQSGAIRHVDIGGAYLTATWFKMGSGKFEIVAYAN